MQGNLSNRVCPLCKTPASAGAEASAANGNGLSRLCEPCRSMIAVIRPQSSASAAVVTVASRPLAPPQPPIPSPFLDEPAEADVWGATPAFPPLTRTDSDDANADDEDRDETILAEAQTAEAQTAEAMIEEADHAEALAPALAPVPEEEQTITMPEEARDGDLPYSSEATPLASQRPGYEPAQHDEFGQTGTGLDETQSPAKKLDGTEINDVPPSWDHQEDFPIFIDHEKEKSLSRYWLPAAALLLLAILAAAYLFIYQPYFSNPAPRAEQQSGLTGDEAGKPAAPSLDETAAQPAEQPATPVADAQPPTPAPPPGANPADGQGKYSLQAASFPAASGAKEFADRLTRAGLPAYITAANIAGRGQWYRVRVGRFPTSAEAETYAAQARQRAKAAGVNLQLVVCEYSGESNQ